MSAWSDLVIAVPTFRRNKELAALLHSIGAQSVQPALTLVLDNSPEGIARKVADASPVPTEYIPLGRNLGPAGSFASAVERCAPRFSWMMCRDDDFIFPDIDALARLHAFQRKVSHLAPACIGNAGEIFVPSLGRSRRIIAAELRAADLLDVDVIVGGGSPTYHLPTVIAAGANFDRSLFFGFEELELGLQLRRSGHRLLLDCHEGIRLRLAEGTLEAGPFDREPGRRQSPWRSYYAHRNRLIVARRYGRPPSPLRLALRSVVKIGEEMLRGAPAQSLATAMGLWDGLRNAPVREAYIPN